MCFKFKIGDTVTVTGEIINYGGTIEFQYATLTTDSAGIEEGLVTIKSILDEAATLENGATLSGTRKTVGTVKEITEAYTTQYKNISFILTDGEADILVFRSKGNCASSLQVGDKVYVEGEVINYGGTIEFQYATLTTENENNTDEPAKIELTTIGSILEAAASLAKDEALPNECKVKGVVSGFEKKFSYSGGEYYVLYVTDETGKIYVYSPTGDALETLANGDTVYVKGSVKNYKGTIEFDNPMVSFADDFGLSNAEKLTAEEKTPIIPEEVQGDYEFISIPMALAIAKDGGEDFESSEKYYITGWVESVSNYSYGSITITDGNVSIYAYGISNYSSNEKWPLVGDVVVLEAVIGTNGTNVELKNSTKLLEWYDVAVDETQYTSSTIAEARNAEAGEKIIVEGVVAGYTYKNAKTKSQEYVRDGLYLVSGSDSIYLYAPGVCSVTEIGNTIKVAGVKEYFIQSSEIELAEKYGFAGACQLSNVQLISSNGGNTSILENNFETTTVKELMENEYNDNITNQIYKVNALINKSLGSDFVNYYINDLDETTGTYTYTKCNGNDFAWIDEYLNSDGQYLCTLLVTVCNAKATSSGCNWRMVPIAILSSYTFDVEDTADFVLDYYALPQFEKTYYANPAIKLVTSHSSELLGFEGATIEYVSDNTSVVSVDVEGENTVLNVNAVGEANVTITVTHNGQTATATVKIVRESEPTFDSLTVSEAIATAVETEILVEGIVGPSLVNQSTGFYIIDETGAISVKMLDSDQLAKVSQGNRVVIKGTRVQYRSAEGIAGQAAIIDAELVHNYYGEHEYSTVSFEESTLTAISQYPVSADWSSKVFIVEATAKISGRVVVIESGQDSIALYCSGVNQYAWLTDISSDEIVKMEVALCNWNEKTEYKACVLAVYKTDGTKVINSLNFGS